MSDNQQGPAPQDQMSPYASPGTVAKKAGVRRVNNMPVFIVGGVMAAFLLMMIVVAADRSAQQNKPLDATKAKGGSTATFANAITAGQTDGFIAASMVPPPDVPKPPDSAAPATPAIQVVKPTDMDKPPLPPGTAQGGGQQMQNPPLRSPRDQEQDRIRQAKMQMMMEAVKAKTTVHETGARSAASAPGGLRASSQSAGNMEQNRQEVLAKLAVLRQQAEASGDATEVYKAKLEQLRASGLIGGGAGGNGSESGAPTLIRAAAVSEGKNDIGQFDKKAAADRWKLDSQQDAPRSAYELRAGSVVPGTLISGINSELPGQIMAQVSQDVYDTPSGRYLLIPQGSRLVGQYSSQVAYGQSRVLVAWQRIVFPDGKALDIGSMPGADQAGYAGFEDQVNNHYLRIFGSALLMSGVVAGVEYSQRSNENTNNTASTSSTMSQALGQELGQVSAHMIEKNMNIAPTLEIRPGFRLNIIVTKDLDFSKPYENFDY